MTGSVVVSRELLAKVLDQAEGDLWAAHGEYCVSTDKGADGSHGCDKAQEAIAELREEALR